MILKSIPSYFLTTYTIGRFAYLFCTMALDAATAQELVRKLAADREAYLETLNKSHELLIQLITGNTIVPSSLPRLTSDVFRQFPTSTLDVESVQKGSGFSGDFDTDSDDPQSLSIQNPLSTEEFTEQGFKKHLLEYKWPEASKKILHGVLENNELLGRSPIFPSGQKPVPDRSHLTHYTQVYSIAERICYH